MTKPDTPQLDKMLAVKDQSQVCGQLLDWLKEQGIVLASYDGDGMQLFPSYRSIERILGAFFEIDLDAAEQERMALLEWVRQGQP